MNIITKYENYLKDAATPFETDEFTRQIIKNYYEEEALKAHWKSILEKRHKEHWKSILEKEHKTDSKKDTASSFNKRLIRISTLIGIAASLLVILYINKPSQTIASSQLDQLLEQHYNHPLTRNIVKGEPSVPNTKSDAYNHYQNKDYEKAIPLLQQIVKEGSADEDDHFFLGLAQLYNNNPNAAISQFEWILEQPNPQRRDFAVWHMALALIAAEDFDRAKIYLSEVVKWDNNIGQRKFAKSAKELMDAIGKK